VKRAARGRPSGDEGSGTVIAIALAGVVVLVGLVLAGVGAGVSARARAQSAADLAALAAGDVLATQLALAGADGPGGGEAACARASEVAARNGARLEGCVREPGSVVVVHVSRATPWGSALAGARAGPRPGG